MWVSETKTTSVSSRSILVADAAVLPPVCLTAPPAVRASDAGPPRRLQQRFGLRRSARRRPARARHKEQGVESADGALAVPLSVKVVYARAGGPETRTSPVVCKFDAAGRVVGVK